MESENIANRLSPVKEAVARFSVDLSRCDRRSANFIRIEAGLMRLKKQRGGKPDQIE
jgi:hypothetical protein